MSQQYRTIPGKANFTDEEKVFWVNQCCHANDLINCAIYYTRQSHFERLEKHGDAFTTYWRGDELRYGWKTYFRSFPQVDKSQKYSLCFQ